MLKMAAPLWTTLLSQSHVDFEQLISQIICLCEHFVCVKTLKCMYKHFKMDLGLFTPGKFTIGFFTPRIIHLRIFHPQDNFPTEISPPEISPLGLFTPWIIHPLDYSPLGLFTPGKFTLEFFTLRMDFWVFFLVGGLAPHQKASGDWEFFFRVGGP